MNTPDAVLPAIQVDPSFDLDACLFLGLQHAFRGPYASPAASTTSLSSSPLPTLTNTEGSATPASSPSVCPSPAPITSNKPHDSPSRCSSPVPISSETPHGLQEKSRASKRKLRSKASGKKNKKAKKKEQQRKQHQAEPQSRKLALKHIQDAKPIPTTYNAESFPIASTAYVGSKNKESRKKRSRTFELDELVGPQSNFKFELRVWDGIETMPIIDKKQRIMAVCAGRPKKDKTWNDVHRRAAQLLEEARGRLDFDIEDKVHRRGKFHARNFGISHGGGQPYPKILNQKKHNQPILDELIQDPAFTRISGFASETLLTWAPRLHSYQMDYIDRLIANDDQKRADGTHPKPQDPLLRRNWPNTPWGAACFNFGPNTVCTDHTDFGNYFVGWCPITAMGLYDYKTGGHLILWDLGLVIEFPPGSTILIPSSAMRHSNVRIKKEERRYSFTQYNPGGLFRWVDNGFQTVVDYMGKLDLEEQAAVMEELSKKFEEGLTMYSTVAELETSWGKSISMQ